MKVAIIGANEFQNKIILKCKENNIETHVFAWKDNSVGENNADYFYDISIIDKEKILSICKELNIDGVISIGSDLAMVTVNFIANQLNLVGNTLYCTEVSTNKFKMREAFEKYNVNSPKYILINEHIQDKEVDMKYPLIVKPTDRSGSRGVTKVLSNNELFTAYSKAMEQSFNKEVILEQYIGGKEYSMEFITEKSRHSFLTITEKFTTGAPNFIEKAHIQPAKLTNEVLNTAVSVATNALNSLQVTNGASHVEIKIENNKVYVIEVGARMGGDFIGSDLVRLSTGVDFTQLTLDVSLGKQVEIKCKFNKFSMVYFIFNNDDVKKVHEHYSIISPFIVEKVIELENIRSSVTDSSNRHGYIILQFNNEKDLNNIKQILLGNY